ncbi:MAG: phosphotransferase family protein [Planctomycetaceae bacterium]|nr:phosphotransferase family protein [Planctomycetaceae bacterium]
MSIERVKRLAFWDGAEVDAVPLEGGITNRNYLVTVDGRRYVVRQCAAGAHLGIDRRNERACHRAAAQLGVSPDLVHHEQEFLVTDFVPGKTLEQADLHDPDCLDRAARTLARLHATESPPAEEILAFSAFAALRSYIATANRQGAWLPDDIAAILADADELEAGLAPHRPVLCHNDLLPANLIDTGERVWIVDWELAGAGHPMFDLGGLASNAELPDLLVDVLLRSYGLAGDRARRELQVFRAISLLREALWGAVQSVCSPLPVDYEEYARVHFDRYRAARKAI